MIQLLLQRTEFLSKQLVTVLRKQVCLQSQLIQTNQIKFMGYEILTNLIQYIETIFIWFQQGIQYIMHDLY